MGSRYAPHTAGCPTYRVCRDECVFTPPVCVASLLRKPDGSAKSCKDRDAAGVWASAARSRLQIWGTNVIVYRCLSIAVAAAALVAGALSPPASASVGVELSARDQRGDAHRALDITRVDVSRTNQALRVAVTVRDYASMETGGVGTAVGVHFDTRGDGKPDHLVRIEGMHAAAGSTRGWNELRPNGLDPWGDWIDCFPDGWDQPVIASRPAKNEVVVTAPWSCLGDPDSVRIAVQSYKPYRTRVTSDWMEDVRRYAVEMNRAE